MAETAEKGVGLSELLKFFALGFSALLPLVNPPGSALEFLGIVGLQPAQEYKSLAFKIAVSTALFFLVIDLIGSYLLRFFGISLEILQFAGGIVVAAIGWSMLNQPETARAKEDATAQKDATETHLPKSWQSAVFYPLTFPVTAGPGSVAVMLTLSAHANGPRLSDSALAFAGLMLAVCVLSILVYVCYAYAPQMARKVSPSTVHGILRVIAFLLLCIGVQIAWNGLEPMLVGAFKMALQGELLHR